MFVSSLIHRSLKGKVTPKRLLFLCLTKATNHSPFPLTKVSASKVPAILKTFTSKEAQNSTLEVTILKLYLVVRQFFVTLFSQTRNWREGEKPVRDFASCTRSMKCIFQAIIHFTILTASIFGV